LAPSADTATVASVEDRDAVNTSGVSNKGKTTGNAGTIFPKKTIIAATAFKRK
jgi:hypothetical protein